MTKGPGTGEGDRRDLAINRDQRGPEGPAMAEINARALMFNLGREDAIDSTTSAKIARYAERKQLAYKLTDEGVLLLDGRGKKIHLRNGVVTLRNALCLHALPDRCHAIGDNRVLNKQQQHTNVVTMLHVRKESIYLMACVIGGLRIMNTCWLFSGSLTIESAPYYSQAIRQLSINM